MSKITALWSSVQRKLRALTLVLIGAAAGLQGLPEGAKQAISPQPSENIDEFLQKEETKTLVQEDEEAAQGPIVQIKKKADRIVATVEKKAKAVVKDVKQKAKVVAKRVGEAAKAADDVGCKIGSAKDPRCAPAPLPQPKPPQEPRVKTNFTSRELK